MIQFADDLATGFMVVLRDDQSWKGDFTDEEREALLSKGIHEFLKLRFRRDGIDYGEQQLLTTMALRVMACMFKNQ